MRASWVLVLFVGCGPRPDAPVQPPILTGTLPAFVGEPPSNLLVVSIDTLQRNRMATYGGDVSMPFMDRILDEGVRLDTHMSCSNWTFASILCVQTGMSATEIGFVPGLSGKLGSAPTEPPDLAARLADHGYTTVLGTSNEFFSTERGTATGFDATVIVDDLPAEDLHAQTLPVLEERRGDGPWYYHLHVMEPHVPYAPPEAYRTGLEDLQPIDFDLDVSADHYEALVRWITLTEDQRETVADHMEVRYNGELRWLDDQLAAIFDDLDARGLLEDTLVLIWSDHGEQFWEHGAQAHANALYWEETDALAVLWSRNIIPTAHRGPTTHIDLAPTLFTALDLPLPDNWTGFPVGKAADDRPIHAVTDGRSGVVQSVRVGPARLHYWWTGLAAHFDLDDDPEELADLSKIVDPTTTELWDLLQAETERIAPLVEQEPVPPATAR